jgi:hypothetical protein
MFDLSFQYFEKEKKTHKRGSHVYHQNTITNNIGIIYTIKIEQK